MPMQVRKQGATADDSEKNPVDIGTEPSPFMDLEIGVLDHMMNLSTSQFQVQKYFQTRGIPRLTDFYITCHSHD